MIEQSDLLRSRFSGVAIASDRPALLGLTTVNATGVQLFLNDVGIAAHEYLLPDSQGTWTITVDKGSAQVKGKFAQHAIPSENDVQTVVAIGEVVNSAVEVTWRDLEEISPTVPDLGDKIKLTLFERAILRNLSYLEEVCVRPKAYLKVETARLLVSQARRIPSRAIPYLAAHTEDWERPTIRAVQPKRILAEVRQDEFDIYENRLAARLVDKLLLVITPRIAEVKKARRILAELLDYRRSTGGWHWRAERICSLWAEAVTSAQSEKRASHTLEALTTIRQRLLALRDSNLYYAIPRNANVADSLKMTNILATDPVYKHVAVLWLAWSRHTTRRRKAPAEVLAEYRLFCDSFNSYCLVLVVRALSQFGIRPDLPDKGFALGAGPIQLNRKGLAIERLADGSIQIRENGRALITFFTLPAALNSARTDDELDGWLSDVCSAVKGSPHAHNVVLYLSPVSGASRSLSPAAHVRLHTIGNSPSSGGVRNFGFVPVSPWEIDCVERVARCLRWVITGRSLRAFPAVVKSVPPEALTSRPLPRWLRMIDNSLLVVRHPLPDEWSASNMDQLHEGVQRTLSMAEHEEREATAAKQRRRTAPHQQKELAQNIQKAKRAVLEARSAFRVVDLFRKEIQEILRGTEDISECPVCKTSADPGSGFIWDRTFYRFACNDCNAQWGVRTCRCGERVPFLRPASAVAAVDRTPGWIDRHLGRDVLGVPHSDGTFECSACGGAV